MKMDLFFCQVIGWIQYFMPICYLQAFQQGLHFLIEESIPFARSLQWKVNHDLNFTLHIKNIEIKIDCSTLGWCFAICPLSGFPDDSLEHVSYLTSFPYRQVTCTKALIERKQHALATLFRECETSLASTARPS